MQLAQLPHHAASMPSGNKFDKIDPKSVHFTTLVRWAIGILQPDFPEIEQESDQQHVPCSYPPSGEFHIHNVHRT